MTRGQVILLIIVVLLIMFAPVFFADSLSRFFAGLAVIYHQFTK